MTTIFCPSNHTALSSPTRPYPAAKSLCASTRAVTKSDKAALQAKLLDECLQLESKLYGKRLELAMHVGSRENAVFWRECMEKAVKARRDLALSHSEQSGDDFFVAAGAFDGRVMKEVAAHGG